MGRGQAARQRFLVPSYAGSNPAVPAFYFGERMKHNLLACIILAAGQGTRMKSSCPKVLTFFENKTIIEHVIEKAKLLETDQIVVVVSPNHIKEFESKIW